MESNNLKTLVLDKNKEDEWKKDVRANNTGFFWNLDDECTYTYVKDRTNVVTTECQSEGTWNIVLEYTGKLPIFLPFLQILQIV